MLEATPTIGGRRGGVNRERKGDTLLARRKGRGQRRDILACPEGLD